MCAYWAAERVEPPLAHKSFGKKILPITSPDTRICNDFSRKSLKRKIRKIIFFAITCPLTQEDGMPSSVTSLRDSNAFPTSPSADTVGYFLSRLRRWFALWQYLAVKSLVSKILPITLTGSRFCRPFPKQNYCFQDFTSYGGEGVPPSCRWSVASCQHLPKAIHIPVFCGEGSGQEIWPGTNGEKPRATGQKREAATF